MSETLRVCSKCRTAKPLSCFQRDARKTLGLRCDCRDCCTARHKRYRTTENGGARCREAVERYRKSAKGLVVVRKLSRRIVLRKHGLTEEDFRRLHKRQGGLCPICSAVLESGRTDIDHDHGTGKVRALLCRKCNLLLGYCQDSIDVLKAAIGYLENHKKME